VVDEGHEAVVNENFIFLVSQIHSKYRYVPDAIS
jgi:hypothetical protein